ncbi:hypothetical protein [Mesorhizobium sp. CN2-181]|uniref:hypothetical protein n=1 Tax=Mesorhizobium yinganensis TaxID=3157707 RepID=UPI0032B82FAB
MAQLVREQGAPGDTAGAVGTCREEDVVAKRKGLCLDQIGGFGRGVVDMDPGAFGIADLAPFRVGGLDRLALASGYQMTQSRRDRSG